MKEGISPFVALSRDFLSYDNCDTNLCAAGELLLLPSCQPLLAVRWVAVASSIGWPGNGPGKTQAPSSGLFVGDFLMFG